MYRKSIKGWLKHADFIVLDLVSLQIAFILAYLLRYGFANPYAGTVYWKMAVYLVIADLFIILFFETMKNVLKRDIYQEVRVTVKQAFLIEVLCCVYLFAIHEGNTYSRRVLYLTGLIYFLLSCLSRLLWKDHIQKRMRQGGGRRSLLIVTDSRIVQEVLANLRRENYERFVFSGIVLTDVNQIGGSIGGVPVVADMKTAAEYVIRHWIDEVIAVPCEGSEIPEQFLEQFMEAGITVHKNLARLENAEGKRQQVEQIGGYTVLTTSLNSVSFQYLLAKRLLDICGGLVGCFITLLLYLILGPFIYSQSPGPVFFTQTRVGKNGKTFRMYKFRSMCLDAEKRKKELMEQNRVKGGLMFKVDFDPRVIGNRILPDGTRKTGIGQFIRSTSLDEFPQFFNVLKGDMSLVGPRPPTCDEWDKYRLHHKARLAIRPGITGLWQVSGRSGITDFEAVVRLDKEYIENWSIGLDIRILFRTVAVVLKKDGSV